MSDVSYTPRCEFCGYPLDTNNVCTNPNCGKSIVSEATQEETK
jgi:hypothetical protein